VSRSAFHILLHSAEKRPKRLRHRKRWALEKKSHLLGLSEGAGGAEERGLLPLGRVEHAGVLQREEVQVHVNVDEGDGVRVPWDGLHVQPDVLALQGQIMIFVFPLQ